MRRFLLILAALLLTSPAAADTITIPSGGGISDVIGASTTCSDDEIPKASSGVWACGTDTGAAGGDSITVETGFSAVVDPLFANTSSVTVTGVDLGTDEVRWTVLNAPELTGSNADIDEDGTAGWWLDLDQDAALDDGERRLEHWADLYAVDWCADPAVCTGAELQSAIDFACDPLGAGDGGVSVGEGRVLHFPAGEFTLTATLDIGGSGTDDCIATAFRGGGAGFIDEGASGGGDSSGTTFIWGGGSSTDPIVQVTRGQYITLEDFNLLTSAARDGTADTTVGLRLGDASGANGLQLVTVRNVGIKGEISAATDSVGLWIGSGDADSQLDSLLVDNVRVNNFESAVFLNDTQAVNNVIQNSKLFGNDSAALLQQGQITFRDNIVRCLKQDCAVWDLERTGQGAYVAKLLADNNYTEMNDQGTEGGEYYIRIGNTTPGDFRSSAVFINNDIRHANTGTSPVDLYLIAGPGGNAGQFNGTLVFENNNIRCSDCADSTFSVKVSGGNEDAKLYWSGNRISYQMGSTSGSWINELVLNDSIDVVAPFHDGTHFCSNANLNESCETGEFAVLDLTTPTVVAETDGALTLRADTNLVLELDNDNDGSNTLTVLDGADATVLTLTEAGLLSVPSLAVTTGSATVSSSANPFIQILDTDTSDPADGGQIRMENAQTICWEASPAGTDVCISADTGELVGVTGGVFAIPDNSTLGTIAYDFPPNNGDAGQVLQTDGAGNLTWEADATGGGGGSGSFVVNDSTVGIYLDVNNDSTVDDGELRFQHWDVVRMVDYCADPAACDGTDIQAAIDSCTQDSGCRVDICNQSDPEISVGSTIVIDPGGSQEAGLILQGCGSGDPTTGLGTALRWTGSAGSPVIQILDRPQNIQFKDFSIRLYDTDITNEASIGIEVNATSGHQHALLVDNMWIKTIATGDSGAVGILFNDTVANIQIDFAKFSNLHIDNVDKCFVQESQQAKNNRFDQFFCTSETSGAEIQGGAVFAGSFFTPETSDADATYVGLLLADTDAGASQFENVRVSDTTFDFGVGTGISTTVGSTTGPGQPLMLLNNRFRHGGANDSSVDFIDIITDGPVIVQGNRFYSTSNVRKTAVVDIDSGTSSAGKLYWIGNLNCIGLTCDYSGVSVPVWAPNSDGSYVCNNTDLNDSCDSGELILMASGFPGAVDLTDATAVLVNDSDFQITGSSNDSKIVKFEVDGITGTNTITVPDGDIVLPAVSSSTGVSCNFAAGDAIVEIEADGTVNCDTIATTTPSNDSVGTLALAEGTATGGDGTHDTPAVNELVRVDDTGATSFLYGPCTMDDNGAISCPAHPTDGGSLTIQMGADDGTGSWSLALNDSTPLSPNDSDFVCTIASDGSIPSTDTNSFQCLTIDPDDLTGDSSDDDDLDVAAGGTGVSTLTDHGVLVGSGASDITALSVGTNGQLLVGSTGADPTFATLNADAYLTATTGAGTLELDADIELAHNTWDIVIQSPNDSTDDFFFSKVPVASTIQAIDCIISNNDSSGVTIAIEECSTAGASCAGGGSSGTLACGGTAHTNDSGIVNAGLAAGAWMNFNLTGNDSGTLTITVDYTVDD